MSTTPSLEEKNADSFKFGDFSTPDVDPATYVYRQLAPASDFVEGEGKPFTVEGTHLAVFLYEGKFQAVDNRCPHMGYPMSQGSIRDGVLICHWHHWEFDLKTGGCLQGLSNRSPRRRLPVGRHFARRKRGGPSAADCPRQARARAGPKRPQRLPHRQSRSRAAPDRRHPTGNNTAGALLRGAQDQRGLVFRGRNPDAGSQSLGRYCRRRPEPLPSPWPDPDLQPHLRILAAPTLPVPPRC